MNARTYVPWNTVLVLALIGCSSDDGGPSQPPADVQVLAGNNQEALVGQLVAGALRVVVRDAGNAPVRGATVDWVLTVGDGSLSAASSKTDGAGAAQTRLTLGSTSGPRVVTATVG
ncbi:MAG: Ig-like domain-containing protein, partial [Acidimicrobiales bacterium]